MGALDDLNKKNWREMSTLEYLIYITHDSIGIKAACATELSALRSEIERLKAEREWFQKTIDRIKGLILGLSDWENGWVLPEILEIIKDSPQPPEDKE